MNDKHLKSDSNSTEVKKIADTIMQKNENNPQRFHLTALFSLISSAAQSSNRLSPDNWKKCSLLFNELYSSLEKEQMGSSDSWFSDIHIGYFQAMLSNPVHYERFMKNELLRQNIFSLSNEQLSNIIILVYSLSKNYIIPICLSLSSDQNKFIHVVKIIQEKTTSNDLLSFINSVSSSSSQSSFKSTLSSFFSTSKDTDDHRETKQNPDHTPSQSIDNNVSCTNGDSTAFSQNNIQHQKKTDQHTVLSDLNFRNTCIDISKNLRKNLQELRQRSYIFSQERIKSIKLALTECKKEFSNQNEVVELADSLSDSFIEIQNPDAADALLNFRNLFHTQPFTIAVSGEANVGKSSLINMLLQSSISPVSEIPSHHPTIIFQYGKKFQAEIFSYPKHLSQTLHKFEAIPDTTSSHILQLIKGASPRLEKVFSNLTALHDFFKNYTHSELVNSHILISYPAQFLKDTHLIDVSGLYSSSSIENSLAIYNLLRCDCLIFLFSALRPITKQINNLFMRIIENGRADYLIPILTSADLLSSETLKNNVSSKILTQLKEIKNSGIKLFDISILDCRKISNKNNSGKLVTIKNYIDEARSFREKSPIRLRTIGKSVTSAIRTEIQNFYETELSKIPNDLHINFLEKHLERLEKAINKYSANAYSTVNLAAIDIQAWKKEQSRAIDSWYENIVLKISDAANTYADSLGKGMFKEKNWTEFNENIAPKIAADSLNMLLLERRSIQEEWREKFKQFGVAIQKISLLCLDEFRTDITLTDQDSFNFYHERWLVAARSLLEKAGLITFGLALRKGGIGLGIVIGNIGWWSIIPIAFTGTLIWTLMKLGNPSRCRKIFMERKKKLISEWADKQKIRIEEVLNESLEDITSNYTHIMRQNFNPAIQLLSEEALTLRLYIRILKKLKDDTEQAANHLLGKVDEFELALLKN